MAQELRLELEHSRLGKPHVSINPKEIIASFMTIMVPLAVAIVR